MLPLCSLAKWSSLVQAVTEDVNQYALRLLSKLMALQVGPSCATPISQVAHHLYPGSMCKVWPCSPRRSLDTVSEAEPWSMLGARTGGDNTIYICAFFVIPEAATSITWLPPL